MVLGLIVLLELDEGLPQKGMSRHRTGMALQTQTQCIDRLIELSLLNEHFGQQSGINGRTRIDRPRLAIVFFGACVVSCIERQHRQRLIPRCKIRIQRDRLVPALDGGIGVSESSVQLRGEVPRLG
ncbi:MAG: hypothetical protein D6741_15495 [Planctomycetota bacterium]|nr:MAG: hypothetical protein D6741_15495 [Planctomycetota bacterium]